MTPAQQVLDFFSGAAQAAGDGLMVWATALFATLFFFRALAEVVHAWLKNPGIDWGLAGKLVWEFAAWGIVVGLFFLLSWPWLDTAREMGMALSGSSQPTVDVGAIATQAQTVTEAIDETISDLISINPITLVGNMPTIWRLYALDVAVTVAYAVIALISVWYFVKFSMGFLAGGVVIGGVAWDHTRTYGVKAIGYVIFSGLPLLILAFIQGLSQDLLQDAFLAPGEPATVPALKELAMIQWALVVASVAAPMAAKEFLSAMVGTGGAPGINSAARTSAALGGAMSSIASSIQSSISNGRSGGSGAPGGGGSGGGGVPRMSGSAPALTFRKS